MQRVIFRGDGGTYSGHNDDISRGNVEGDLGVSMYGLCEAKCGNRGHLREEQVYTCESGLSFWHMLTPISHAV
jgi:hypothetical protein